MSEYFTPPTAIPPASLAKSSDINAISDAVDTAFESLYPGLRGTESLIKLYASLADRLNNMENQSAAMAGFKGAWSLLTGPLNMPASAYHSNKNWILTSNVADVTAHTPGVSAAWAESYLTISTFDHTVDAQGNILENMVLRNTSEKMQNLGTVTANTAISIEAGNIASLTIGASLTLSITDWPPTETHGEVMLEMTNGGAFAVTWPTIRWILDDGTTTTDISNLSTSLQAVGVDFVFLWSRDAGTTIYGKIIR